VHVDKSFVLVFEIVESENKVLFQDFAHYDVISNLNSASLRG